MAPPTFNCLAFFQVQQIYTRDGLALLRNYPVVYLRSVEAAWFSYFLPAGDFPFFDLNRPKIHAHRSILEYRVLWPVQRSERSQGTQAIGRAGRPNLAGALHRRVSDDWPARALAVEHLLSGHRSAPQDLDPAAAILIGFLLLNIAYVTAIANFLSSFENNRYRFPLDAFYVVLLGVA
jgi:hypothetical protein